MITGAMAYRILQAENPRALSTVQAMLEKHPWYADRWRPDFEPLPETQRGETLFMLAARWADDIRTKDRLSTARHGITSAGHSSQTVSRQA